MEEGAEAEEVRRTQEEEAAAVVEEEASWYEFVGVIATMGRIFEGCGSPGAEQLGRSLRVLRSKRK